MSLLVDIQISQLINKTSLERFLANEYTLSPLIDPDIKLIKYNISDKSQQDLIAYIYIRFSRQLVNFPFSSKRILNPDCIKNAEQLNKLFIPYKIKNDYNNIFYIDKKRRSPVSSCNNFNNITDYLNKLLKSPKFEKIINKTYDSNIYKWLLDFKYGLFTIVYTIDNLSKNKSISEF